MAAKVATDDVVEDKAAVEDKVVVGIVVQHTSSIIDPSEITAISLVSKSKGASVAIGVNKKHAIHV